MRHDCVCRFVPVIGGRTQRTSTTIADPKSSLNAPILSQFQLSTLRLYLASLSVRISENVEESMLLDLLAPESSI